MKPARIRKHRKRIGTNPFSGTRWVAGGTVRIEWRAHGKRHTRTVGRDSPQMRRDADELLGRALSKAKALRDGPATDPDVTLGTLLVRHRKDAQARNLADKTVSVYHDFAKTILRKFSGSMPATTLRRGSVRQWYAELLEQGLSRTTVTKTVDYLKQVYRWAHADLEYIDTNPVAGLKVAREKPETEAYSPEEGQRLMETMLALPRRAWRFRVMALVCSIYGVRANQAVHLTWDDVDLDSEYPVDASTVLQGTITFRKGVLGSKKQDSRTLPILPVVMDALMEAWNHRQSKWVLWNHRDTTRPTTYGSMGQQLRKLERAAHVEHKTNRAFHAFRRAVATVLIEHRGLAHASRYLGDTADVLARTYCKPTKESERQAVATVMDMVTEWQRYGNVGEERTRGDLQTLRKLRQRRTGAGGFEPPTSWLTARRSAN